MNNAPIPDHRAIEGSGRPSATPKETDVPAYAPVSAKEALEDIGVLVAVGGYKNLGFADDRLEDLGFVLEVGDPLEDQANSLIDEMPLAISATTTFEVVLGSGGPDRRLCSSAVAATTGRWPTQAKSPSRSAVSTTATPRADRRRSS